MLKKIAFAALALGLVSGAASAAPVGAQNDTVIEYGCGYGYGH
ncbi:MAG: hypothetical protein R3D68_10650 [Hyphomicrobiaceae bacterium]